MKLLLENWRHYLNEASKQELKQDLIAFVRDNNLDKEAIIQILSGEEVLNEAIGQDLANLYKKYGKYAVGGMLAGMIGVGTVTPAQAGALDYARVGADFVMAGGLSDYKMALKIGTSPRIQDEATKLFKSSYTSGTSSEERASGRGGVTNLAAANTHLDNVIKLLGGEEKALKLFHRADNKKDAYLPVILKYAKIGKEDNIDYWRQEAEKLRTKALQNPTSDNAKWQYMTDTQLDELATAVHFRDIPSLAQLDKNLSAVVGERLDATSAAIVRVFIYQISGELGYGTTSQENIAIQKNAAVTTARIHKELNAQAAAEGW